MRISLLADLHANREALTACLAHAQSVGADRHVFLGDLVGYGADPGWVVDTVAGYCANGAICVRGNHDAAVLTEPRETMRDEARVVVAWTRAHLDTRQLAFLGDLPFQIELDGVLFVHANAWAPQRWEYIQSPFDARSSMAATNCRLTVCGHMHEPQLYHMGADWRAAAFTPTPGVAIPLGAQRRWLAIPGSVGQPRDGSPAACSALFDTESRRLTFYRIPYDTAAATAKLRAAGLPENLSARLELGR